MSLLHGVITAINLIVYGGGLVAYIGIKYEVLGQLPTIPYMGILAIN